MKKIIVLVCILYSFGAGAGERVCLPEEAETIKQMEQALDNCKIDYGESSLTEDMLEAYAKAKDCMRDVAYQVFDKYYVTSNQQAKETFDNYVKSVENLNSNLIQGSDWAKENHLAEVYVLGAEGGNYYMIKNAVKEYIEEMRYECTDAEKDK